MYLIQKLWVLAPFFHSSFDSALPHHHKTKAMEPTSVKPQPPNCEPKIKLVSAERVRILQLHKADSQSR